MATTRDKRMKTDSPVPGQLSEALTPTTKSTAIKLKRLSRNRTSLLAVKSSENEDAETVGMSEDTQSSTTSENPANLAKTPNTRTKRQVIKECKDEESNGDVVKDEEELDTPKKKRGATPIKAEIKKPEKKATGLALIRQKALMKRKGPVSSTLRTLGRRLKGKVDLKSLAKDEKLVKPTKKGVLMKNGRQGRKAGIGAGRKARVVEDKVTEEEPDEEEMEDEEEEEEEELEEEDEVEEEEPTEIEVEEPELEDKIEKELSVPDIVVKQEKIDVKSASIAAAADLSGVRRSTRARKSTNKDRDSSVTSKKKESPEIKKEKFDTKAEPIVIEAKEEKLISKAISITVEATEVSEKDASLSPEMVSEELDTMSVQHLYDKPHFLENNLGIEQDPKLGDIVKVQEKTKISDKEEDAEMKEDSKEIKAKSEEVIESEKMEEDDAEKESASESADESSTKSDEASKVVKEDEKQIVTKKVEEIVPKDKSPESKSDKVEVEIVTEPKDIAKEEITVEKVKESIKTVKKVKQPEVAKDTAAEKPKESVKVLKKTTKTGDAEESMKATIKVEKVDEEASKEESGEENKENNDASGKSSIGSNSPRSEEDCLKSVGEDNIVKPEISNEDIEMLRLKELHFKTLGLLTHKAADAATLATQKRSEEYIKNNVGNSTTSTSYGRKSKNSSSDQGYTGTLKTVIKLHRPREEKRKTRMPLKMTFQKKSRADRDSNGSANSAENSFYTIHNDVSSLVNKSLKINFLIHFFYYL